MRWIEPPTALSLTQQCPAHVAATPLPKQTPNPSGQRRKGKLLIYHLPQPTVCPPLPFLTHTILLPCCTLRPCRSSNHTPPTAPPTPISCSFPTLPHHVGTRWRFRPHRPCRKCCSCAPCALLLVGCLLMRPVKVMGQNLILNA
jgi:hypothetical protein